MPPQDGLSGDDHREVCFAVHIMLKVVAGTILWGPRIPSAHVRRRGAGWCLRRLSPDRAV